MKKLLFSAYSLDIGGIEKALVTLVNTLQNKGYDVTVALEKRQGIFLEKLNPQIHIIEYSPSESKNVIIRKSNNLIKRIKFISKYKNKFDFSACFATYSIPASFMSRVASNNSCLWGHADYFTLFNGDIAKMKQFFIERNYESFKHIVFVSQEGKRTFEKVFPEIREKLIVCNNLIDGNKIKKLAEEKLNAGEIEFINKINLKNLTNSNIESSKLEGSTNSNIESSKLIDLTEIEQNEKENKCVTFLNVGRHDEKQKRLSRIIQASKKLKEENYKFKVLLVGDGQDTEKYKKEVEQNQLQEYILFLGKKQNPYPYFKISDCVILSSDYEGYPVVYLESFVLNKPLITTKVSDYKEVEGKYGYVAEKTTEDIYEKMKLFLEQGFEIKEKFDYQKYNEEKLEKLEKLF